MGETFAPMPPPDDLVSEPPLCVDLDGTLLQTDHLYEALLLLVKRSPFSLLLLPFWLLQGRAAFKEQVGRRVAADASQLPYRAELVAYLREQQRSRPTLGSRDRRSRFSRGKSATPSFTF